MNRTRGLAQNNDDNVPWGESFEALNFNTSGFSQENNTAQR